MYLHVFVLYLIISSLFINDNKWTKKTKIMAFCPKYATKVIIIDEKTKKNLSKYH